MADTQLIGIPIEDLQEADSSNLADETKVIVEDDGTPVTRQCDLGVMADWINDRVVIGGRNLILDGETKTHTRTNVTNNWLVDDSNVAFKWLNSDYGIGLLADGGEFTISFDYVVTGITTACNMYPALRYTEDSYYSYISSKKIALAVGDNSGHYEETFIPTEEMMTYGTQWIITGLGAGNNTDAVFTFSHIKLEKGNKATDWTPAPEDLKSSDITHTKSDGTTTTVQDELLEQSKNLAGKDFAYATMASAFSTGADNNSKLKVVREGAFCFLTGRIVFSTAPTANATIATIPAEYAPPMHHRFPLMVYGSSYITIGIELDGTIKYLGSNVDSPTGTTYGTACWLSKSYN